MSSVADKATVFQVANNIAVALQRLLIPFCEVVVPDFSDFEHSIIAIAGNVTNCKVGGGATDLLLAKTVRGDTDEDLYNYPKPRRESRADRAAGRQGVFQVKKAAPILADQLCLSRATVYNYSRHARRERTT